MVFAFYGFDDAVFDMVFQDQFAGIVDGCFDGGELDEYFTAVRTVFYHGAYFFQVPDRPGEPVQDGFGVLVEVCVLMGVFVWVVMFSFMKVSVSVIHMDS